MIRSVSYDQREIIDSIMKLCGINRFDADVTFGNGSFYKGRDTPFFCSDIDKDLIINSKLSSDSVRGVNNSNNLPIDDDSISSLMFDPPFLTYVRAAREGNGNMVMAKRFGGYWRYDELEKHYRETILEAGRVLKKKGIMVFKCQDIIHNHKMHCTHLNIIKWADGVFRLKDLFILPAKSRMGIPQQDGTKKKIQKHARIFHSYFMVLERI